MGYHIPGHTFLNWLIKPNTWSLLRHISKKITENCRIIPGPCVAALFPWTNLVPETIFVPEFLWPKFLLSRNFCDRMSWFKKNFVTANSKFCDVIGFHKCLWKNVLKILWRQIFLSEKFCDRLNFCPKNFVTVSFFVMEFSRRLFLGLHFLIS